MTQTSILPSSIKACFTCGVPDNLSDSICPKCVRLDQWTPGPSYKEPKIISQPSASTSQNIDINSLTEAVEELIKTVEKLKEILNHE